MCCRTARQCRRTRGAKDTLRRGVARLAVVCLMSECATCSLAHQHAVTRCSVTELGNLCHVPWDAHLLSARAPHAPAMAASAVYCAAQNVCSQRASAHCCSVLCLCWSMILAQKSERIDACETPPDDSQAAWKPRVLWSRATFVVEGVVHSRLPPGLPGCRITLRTKAEQAADHATLLLARIPLDALHLSASVQCNVT